jgi:hypothetical protein
MHRTCFLIVTAFGEAGTGLVLLVLPSAPLTLLLGTDQASPEVTSVARLSGAALLAIGVACWLGRSDKASPAQRGLVTGVLIYDVAAAVILAYAGLFVGLVGIALWPAVALHAALGIWCFACIWNKVDPPKLTPEDVKKLKEVAGGRD